MLVIVIVIVIESDVRVQKQPLWGSSILVGSCGGSRVGCKKLRMMQATRLPLQKSDPLSTEVLSSDSADAAAWMSSVISQSFSPLFSA